MAACAWDKYDPRLGGDGGSGGGGVGGNPVGGSGGAGAGGSGGSAGPACNGIGLLEDDFEAATVASQWSDQDSSSVTDTEQQNGHLEIIFGNTSGAEAGFWSRYYFDASDGEITAELVQPLAAGIGEVQLAVVRNGSFSVRFRIANDTLRVRREVNDSEIDVIPPIAYDPVGHRWLKIREVNGNVSWEVSQDGAAYTPVAQRPTSSLFPMDLVRVFIGGTGSGSTGGTAIWDNVNGLSAGKESFCPAAVLTDDFASDTRSSDWSFSGNDSGTAVNQLGGQLLVSFTPDDAGAYFDYVSSRAYNLTDGFFSIEPLQLHSAPSRFYLRVSDASDALEIAVTDGMLECVLIDDGTSVSQCAETYDATQHRYLRIREGGGKAFWESSADGSSWAEMGSSSPTPIRVDGAQVRFGGSTPDVNPAPGLLIVDNVNLLPMP
jgi:hypothetical protein